MASFDGGIAPLNMHHPCTGFRAILCGQAGNQRIAARLLSNRSGSSASPCSACVERCQPFHQYMLPYVSSLTVLMHTLSQPLFTSPFMATLLSVRLSAVVFSASIEMHAAPAPVLPKTNTALRALKQSWQNEVPASNEGTQKLHGTETGKLVHALSVE